MCNKSLTVMQVLPALNGGGVEKGTLEIGQYLSNTGHHSIVVSAGGRLVSTLKQQGSLHIQADIGAKKISTLKYIFWFRQLLLEIKPDIIHLRSRLPAWICYLAWKTLPTNKRPHLVTTFHGQHSVNRYSKIMTYGERIITVSKFMRDYILQAYPDTPPEKIIVIPRGVNTDLYNPGYQPNELWLSQWYHDFPHTRNKKLLILPGRISRRKGIEDFIQLIERLVTQIPDIHGLIIGETNTQKDHYLLELQHLITNKQLQGHITFIGQRSDLQNIIAISTVLLSLSKKPESFGRTVLEALSMEIPVVGYDHGGVAEQLQNLFPEGKVPVNNIEIATQRVKQILQQNEIFIAKNRTYTLSKMCSDTVSIYQDLLKIT
jgi:glycosyltransferase involved in cell wall biosynthesis